MNQIIFPLSVGNQNKEVYNLNQGLLFLLDKGIINANFLTYEINVQQLKDSINQNPDIFSPATETLIKLFQQQQQLEVNGQVDQPTADKLNAYLKENGAFDEPIQYKVSGVVYNLLKEPIAQQTIIAYDVDLPGARIYKTAQDLGALKENGGFELLGSSITNDDGYYEILFDTSEFYNEELNLADVIVYAVQDGKIIGRSTLSTNKDYYNGIELKDWNIFLATSDKRGISEYNRIMMPVTNFLKLSNLALYQLADSNDQVEFLANETEQDFVKVSLLVQADLLKSDVSKDNLSHELLYGIGRQNIPLPWTSIALTSVADLKKAITTSIQLNIISEYADQEIEDFLLLIQGNASYFLLDDSNAEKNQNINKLLSFSLKDPFLQAAFVTEYKNFSGSPQQFWEEYLPEQPSFKDDPSIIDSLKLTNQLSILTGNHLPLIEELQINKKISSAKDLVAFTEDDWKNVLDSAGWPLQIQEEEKPQYVNGMLNLLNAAFPTDKIALMVKNREIKYEDDSIAATLNNFFEQANTFNFSSSLISDYKDIITLVAKDKEEILTQHLQKLQRVYQVSPTPEAMTKLINLDLTSAYKIANIPEESFLQIYGDSLGQVEAFNIHARASYLTSRMQDAAMTFYEVTHGATPAAATYYQSPDNMNITDVIEHHIPNYEELFGRADICECEHCRSVYGAAAYFVDIMRFLQNSGRNSQGYSPLDILIGKDSFDETQQLKGRRPDLAYLQLTCENTNTLIPYIDLVNEVMEYYVWKGTLDKDAAYNTGDTTTEELRANPQFTRIEAYKKLSDSLYPFSLPYHQPLDVIRKFLEHLQTSRYGLMEAFQNMHLQDEDINALAAEHFALSEKEFTLLTNKLFNPNTELTIQSLEELYGFPDHAPESPEPASEFIAAIVQIPELLKRTGIAYVDLVEIIKTRFINPGQSVLDYVDELIFGTPMTAAILYAKMGQIRAGTVIPSTDESLMALLQSKAITSEGFINWVTQHFDELGSVITLYEPDSKCDLTHTSLRTVKDIYEHITDAISIRNILYRLHRFVRLWKKTGWSVHELDHMILSLGETDITPELIRKLSDVKKIAEALKLPLLQLATIWGNIDIYGDNSLYKKLFLSKSILRDAAFYADNFGNYLSDDTIIIKDYITVILNAFKITRQELDKIISDADIAINAPLSVKNLSIIYRYVLLAKALQLTPSLLCHLKQFCGINPFSFWNPKSDSFIINPSATLAFIEIANNIADSGFTIPAVKYIVSGETGDDTKAFILPEEKILSAIVEIRKVFQQIEQDHPEKNNLIVNEEVLRKDLSLLFTQDITEQLIAILGCHLPVSQLATDKDLSIIIPTQLQSTFSYDALTGMLMCSSLFTDGDRSILENLEGVTENFRSAVRQIYDEQRIATGNDKIIFSVLIDKDLTVRIPDAISEKITYLGSSGRLICRGILSDNEKNSLLHLPDTSPDFQQALESIYRKPEQFLTDKFSPVFEGRLDEAIQTLLNHPAAEQISTVQERQEYFYKAYLPFLKNKLQQNAIVQQVSNLIGLDEAMTADLMKADLIALVQSLKVSGLYGNYFRNTNFTDSAFKRTDEEINFSWNGDSPDSFPLIDPSFSPNTFSVRWEGWINAPADGNYTLFADVAESDETATIWIDDQKYESDPLARSLHKIVLEYAQVSGHSGIQLSWKTETTSKETIPTDSLFPSFDTLNFKAICNQYNRAALFIKGFRLTIQETTHLNNANYAANFSNINFKALSFEHWNRVNKYTRLRNTVHQSTPTLVQVFEEANKTNPPPSIDAVKKLVVNATAWDEEDINILVDLFHFDINNFKNEEGLLWLYEAIQLVKATGISPDMLYDWANTSTDFEELNIQAQNIKESIKAKYEEDVWLQVAKDINNQIRENQKQALISYLLVQPELIELRVQDADGLFEYFLIDVQIDACMETSRIVQANSSVQLFVTRCLLNLESRYNNANQQVGVSTGAIATSRWEWMKNYRLWEANRKIFLYPENWLQPEWRDDKSPFFKELESELLQNDITDAAIEVAFRNYLYKLAGVANLEVCGMYDDKETKTLHVFARTHAVPYQYFYRIRDKNKHWTAWEKLSLDIRSVDDTTNGGADSGVHLIPVVWKKRLFLFWPEFMEKQENSDIGDQTIEHTARNRTASSLQPTKYWEVKLAWSEFKDGKWISKQMSTEFIRVNLYRYREHVFHLKDCYLNTNITDNSELIVHINFAFVQDNSQILQASYGSFQMKDINSSKKIVEENGQLIPAENIAYDYSNWFMSFKRFGSLRLNQKDYFSSSRNHTITYSNQVSHSNAAASPFFYRDAERIYFAEPLPAYSLIDGIRDVSMTAFNAVEVLSTNDTPFNNFSGVNVTTNAKQEDRLIEKRVLSKAIAPANQLLQVQPESFEINAATINSTTAFEQSSSTMNQAFGGASVNGTANNFIPILTVNLPQQTGLRFHTFFHPFIVDGSKIYDDEGNMLPDVHHSGFITDLNSGGIAQLQKADTDYHEDGGKFFDQTYNPVRSGTRVQSPLPKTNVDFEQDGAYSGYNWELFFHIPLFLATRLSKNGKYAEAMKWFHYIFDPTTNEMPDPDPLKKNARYWQVLPFKTTSVDSIEELLGRLRPNADPGNPDVEKITEWRENPFKPHLIARGRPVAYMKNVIFKYVENMVAWGDDLFRQDTMETVNQATQMYIIAAHILGPKPQFIPKRGMIQTKNYNDLKDSLDDFSNALVQLENIFPFSSSISSLSTLYTGSLLGIGNTFYFCIPNNANMLQYWDTVADRLFKIRHCMNIEGVERALALFAPPIDPALLINAAAKGLNIGDILNDLNSPAPLYRFNYLSQKATEFCSEVKALGSALLSAIEKKDAEELGRKRAKHETVLLDMISLVKEKQVLEAKANKQGLEKSRQSAEIRANYYRKLLDEMRIAITALPDLPPDADSNYQLPVDRNIPELQPNVDVALVNSGERGVKLTHKEKEELDRGREAQQMQLGIAQLEIFTNYLHLIPELATDAKPFGVGTGLTFGGKALGFASSSMAKSMQTDAGNLSFQATQAAKMASYIRRDQEWVQQANMAAREIIQIDKQLTAADIRIQITEKELANHKKQIENAKEVEQFLRDKFSNLELYQWMKEQLYGVYRQSYQLAYEMAKKAEKAYRFEIGNDNTSFIQYGYWDGSHQGLVAGEQLHLAIKQMEKAYIEANRREFELTKHISLSQLNPFALLQLKATGSCEVELPEELFDMDYPGHYFRRIKSVSITIPCVVGPYTTVNCTLRLLKNSIRINTWGSQYEHNHEESVSTDDDRFVENSIPFTSIATSSAQNDSGVFELSFRDERYLPFEGAGVISRWQLELNGKYVVNREFVDISQFDYNTISDVIVHLKYTAKEDAGTFRDNAVLNLKKYLKAEIESAPQPFMRLFSLKNDFPNAFHQLLYSDAQPQFTEFEIRQNHFSYLFTGKTLRVGQTQLLLKPAKVNGVEQEISTPVNIKINDAAFPDYIVGPPHEALYWEPFSDTKMKISLLNLGEYNPVKNWKIEIGTPTEHGLDKSQVEDILILLTFNIPGI